MQQHKRAVEQRESSESVTLDVASGQGKLVQRPAIWRSVVDRAALATLHTLWHEHAMWLWISLETEDVVVRVGGHFCISEHGSRPVNMVIGLRKKSTLGNHIHMPVTASH